MTSPKLEQLVNELREDKLVPYLGPGVLFDVKEKTTGEKMASTSDELIIAMNNGPMAPKLMYEFPRAAMNLELKRGRTFIMQFLSQYYAEKTWTRSAIHEVIATLKPSYVIDINRDIQLQDSYRDTPHTLIRGISRVAGTDYRFVLHEYTGSEYKVITQEEINLALPILFKPMGSPFPDPTYIASDADYVDYITELMGGFAIPTPLKGLREGKRYLFIGLRMLRDTERMVLSDLIYSADTPAGYALLHEPNKKEIKFCQKQNIEIVEADVNDLLLAMNTEENAA